MLKFICSTCNHSWSNKIDLILRLKNREFNIVVEIISDEDIENLGFSTFFDSHYHKDFGNIRVHFDESELSDDFLDGQLEVICPYCKNPLFILDKKWNFIKDSFKSYLFFCFKFV